MSGEVVWVPDGAGKVAEAGGVGSEGVGVPLSAGTRLPLARVHDVGLYDLDGVLYVGPDAVPGAPEAVVESAAAGLRPAYVTNNAARTPAAVARHLRELGIPADAEDVVTSAQAAASVLAERLPPGARVLVVGAEGLVEAVRERGLAPVDSAEDGVSAVVQGFGPEVGWRLLSEAAFAVADGALWVASNLDSTVPTPRGRAPGNGALVGVVATATGRRPDVVAGKPELAMHAEALRRTGAGRPLVVGDRLDTDIEGARRAGVPSLLVLTGVCRPGDLVRAAARLRPTYLSRGLREGLLRPHTPVELRSGLRECGGWGVEVSPEGLIGITGGGDQVDGLRALCVALWAAEDAAGAAGQCPDDSALDSALTSIGW